MKVSKLVSGDCDESDHEQHDERPGHENVSAPEIKYQVGGKYASEEELQNVDVPEMQLPGIGLVAFSALMHMDERDENADDE
mgnify:CR=1 FL=1